MSVQVHFSKGDQVRYVPGHAHGDSHHPDCELGEVTSTNQECVFVRFAGKTHSQACDPDSLILARFTSHSAAMRREQIPALCIGCGCDDDHACADGCRWLRIDREECLGVCSSCPELEAAWDAGERELSDAAMEHAAEIAASEDSPEEPSLILPGDVTYADTLRYLRSR